MKHTIFQFQRTTKIVNIGRLSLKKNNMFKPLIKQKINVRTIELKTMKTHIFFLFFIVFASCNRKAHLENPFTGDELYLPYDIDECGVGLPIVLEKKSVNKALFTNFERKGIPLEQKYLYEDENISFLVDGYNAEKKIGYIWITEACLEADAISNNIIENFKYSMEAGRYESEEDSLALRRDIDTLEKMFYVPPKIGLSLAEVKYILDKQEKGELFIALINHFDERYSLPYNHLRKIYYKPKNQRKTHSELEQDMNEIEQKRLKRKRKTLVRDMNTYYFWSRKSK